MDILSLDEPGKFSWRTGEIPEPANGEALVRVHRIGICGTDIHAYAGRQPFFEYPRVLGHELGVEVVSVNGEANGIKEGDHCSVEPYMNNEHSPASKLGKVNCCENLSVFGIHSDGGFCSHICVPTHKLHKSESLDFEQLSLIETLCIGAHAIERSASTSTDSVLVIGSGPIGLAAIQSVLATGATVTVMDMSDSRLDFVRDQIGVSRTLKPVGDDTAKAIADLNDGRLPSVIIDATGNQQSMENTISLAANACRIVFVGLFQGKMSFDDPTFHKKELTLMASRNALPQTFAHVINLVESGKIDTAPWITHRLAFRELDKTFPETIKDPGLIKAIVEMENA